VNQLHYGQKNDLKRLL